MNRKQKTKAKSPLIRLVGLEAAVAATGIAGSLARPPRPPGDLDPASATWGGSRTWGSRRPFGRPTWRPTALSSPPVGKVSTTSYYNYYYEDNFSSRLLSTGAIAADFLAVPLENSVIYDAARQADGRLVEVGQVRLVDGSVRMQVSRRLPDGTLDPGFGLNGKVWIDDGTTARVVGRSVIVDADQRIVVAGTRNSSLIVVRLLPDGTLDPGFATGGKYLPADATGADLYQPRVAAAPGGGYRVASNTLAVSTNSCLCGHRTRRGRPRGRKLRRVGRRPCTVATGKLAAGALRVHDDRPGWQRAAGRKPGHQRVPATAAAGWLGRPGLRQRRREDPT